MFDCGIRTGAEMTAVQATPVTRERSPWRAAAMPAEHGGWGLTLEPVLLGLLIGWSVAGVALGVAAFAAFLVRTPLKLVAVDVRHDRWLARSTLALRIAAGELAVLGTAVAVVVADAGWRWLAPVAVAAPLVAVELWFDVRSRGRRLLPELCGSVGIAAVAAAIVVADGRGASLAAGAWLILGGRVVGAIPFVRVQILRLRRGAGPIWQSDAAQLVTIATGAIAVAVDHRTLAGALGLLALAAVQVVWVRRPPVPAKVIGMRQLVLGLSLVTVTAIGVLTI